MTRGLGAGNVAAQHTEAAESERTDRPAAASAQRSNSPIGLSAVAGPSRSMTTIGPRSAIWLQQTVGNGVASAWLTSIQRKDRQEPPGENSEGDPALVRQYEQEIETVENDASQDRDLFLRAYANRAALLLKFRQPRPSLVSQQILDDFVGQCHQLATTEMDTLHAFGSWAEFALDTTPKAFPLTWSGRVHSALTLGIDSGSVVAESVQQLAALSEQSNQLPPRLIEKGIPVPLYELGAMRGFELLVKHARAPEGQPVGDFARATARYAVFRLYANFAFTWEHMVNAISEAVADGTYVPRFHDYDDFVKNKQRILRELPQRARERLTLSEEELQALQTQTMGLGDAALLTGFTAGLTGLLGIFAGWDQGKEMFASALRIADGMVAGGSDGDRIAMAFRWLWDAGYAGSALGEAVNSIISNGPEMLKALAVIIILQMIPFVDVAVDVYLLFQLGADVLSQLTELGLALSDVMAARSVEQLQRAAGRLARVLTAGAIQIVTMLITMGVVKGVSALRGRAARIRAANPALSEEEAMSRAMREAPSSERAPLEATRGLDPWERGLSQDTRPILDTPGVRQKLAGASDRTRRVLTLCASPCLPPASQLLAADLQRLDSILERLGTSADQPGLREYFYRRRATLAQAIDDLDRGAPLAADLQEFLDRAVVGASRLPPGVTVLRDPAGRWVYRRPPGSPGRSEILEYELSPYRQRRDSGTNGFFQSHHAVQGEWAMARRVPGYSYDDAPGILLRDSHAGSPHQIVTARQTARSAARATSTYAEERALMRQDLETAGVPESFIQAAEQANDQYFEGLYRSARAWASPTQLRAWFGSWAG